ncbi:MAG: lysophospholipid acyltransferase family protein [Bacteroidia bacterium]
MFKNLLRYVFSVYAIIAFLPTLIIVYIIYVLVINLSSKKNMVRNTHRVSSTWARVFYALIFIRVKIANRNAFDKNRVYVFVSNHRSLLDVPVWARACKIPVRFLSKEEMTKMPVFGYVLKRVYLTVNRADRNDRLKSIAKMKATLDEGTSVFLAPEGTRNKSENILLELKDGAFRLAIMAQVPIGVLTLYNTDNLLSPLKLFSMLPGTIYGIWENPIETKGMTENDIPKLKEQVRVIMERNYLMMKNKNLKI